jgi:diguanylate cyclase (GGDEF)-like protein
MALVHKDQLLNQWRDASSAVEYAFQPLVSSHTGATYGFEALLRRWDAAGFRSIGHFFDRAAEDGLILEVNAFLLRRAITLYLELLDTVPRPQATDDASIVHRLFFNVDNRVFFHPDAGMHLVSVIEESGVPPEQIVLEITEQTPLPPHAHDPQQLPHFRKTGIQVALDDFGSGFSGLQVLYESRVDIIKIDRFFISDIDRDGAKRIFITNLVNMAHAMGQRVVAEGIETDREFYVCREIGCDFIQGFLIAKPQLDHKVLRGAYPIVQRLVTADRRSSASSEKILLRRMSQIPPIPSESPVMEVLQRFRKEPDVSYIPVVNEHGEPQGIIREKDLKAYVYSPYGISLLMNRSYQTEFYSYIKRVPIVSIYSRLERILEMYAMDPDADALILTDNGAYKGCLDSKALLQILHERELATARDQNPLTRLPGNSIINEYLSSIFRSHPTWSVLVYFDFNYFKPFNDTYGFRVGDRVIQLFADILRGIANEHSAFAGHIGGDDFFLAFEADDDALSDRINDVRRVLTRFAQDVLAFYSSEDIERGCISGVDREGVPRTFSMLDAGAAILLVPPHDTTLPFRELSQEITTLKHSAKRSADNIVIASIVPPRSGC